MAGTYSYELSSFFHKYTFCPIEYAPLAVIEIVPLLVRVPFTYINIPFGPPYDVPYDVRVTPEFIVKSPFTFTTTMFFAYELEVPTSPESPNVVSDVIVRSSSYTYACIVYVSPFIVNV